jgi:hypothetical protein
MATTTTPTPTFVDAGFVETAFHAPKDATFQIGADRYTGPARELGCEHLFTFLRQDGRA